MECVFINPSPKGEVFWDKVSSIMLAAATNLDVKLTIKYADIDNRKYLVLAQEIVNQHNSVDYILFIHKNITITQKLLDLFEQHKKKSILFNTQLSEKEYQVLGPPQTRYKYWLGTISPDDTQAGFTLAKELIEHSQRLHPQKSQLILLGLGGNETSNPALQRKKGLFDAINHYPNVKLIRFIPSQWFYETAYEHTKYMLKRHKRVDIIWAASDLMAMAALQAVQEAGLKPGYDTIIGGIDWVPEAIHKIKQQQLSVSVGGHYLEGAWVLISAFDHHHMNTAIGQNLTKMYPVTLDNIKLISNKILSGDYSSVNFTQFSRFLTANNPQDKNKIIFTTTP
ncbi:ABC transporter substrate-binding protein [Zooshikella harenae]|uniref:ABC transporter substrate-binding protein n=1 Tax=Zooshikella harenae TaxID=2827238 RepID=A0ABS5ZB28_9GAMM|nr:ABC transporter substrate-binding protein [Zooshikella harenae]MBU2711190.1 ABC transporter substrate-binding protein [Zooshikella harenae]